MRFEYDPEADAVYVQLSDAKVAKSKRVDAGVVLDLDRNSRLVGIEVYSLSRRVEGAKPLASSGTPRPRPRRRRNPVSR